MKIQLRLLFLLVLIFTIQTNYSQLRFNHISGEDGLSHNTIRSVIQDKNGFIWIGTYNGINKYDGYSMKHYKFSNIGNGLSSNIIISLFEDKDGNIWAGTTDAGVNRINIKTGQVDVYFNNPQTANYISEISEIYQNETGIMFINHDNGIKIFNVDNNGKLLYEKHISSVDGEDLKIRNTVSSKNGNHWIFSPSDIIKLSQLIIQKKHDSISVSIKKTDISSIQFKNGYPVDFLEYPKNTIWLISNRLQLLKIQLDDDLKELKRDYYNLVNNPSGISIKKYPRLKIVVDKKSNLWIAGDKELIKFNIKNGKIFRFENNNIPKQIQDILIDYSNILWLGTMNNGLYKLDLENNTFSNSKDYLTKSIFDDHPVMAINEDNRGNIWFGLQQDGGLVLLKEKEIIESTETVLDKPWSLQKLGEKFNNTSLFEIKRIIKDGRGDIWVGSKGGISKFKYLPISDTYDITTFDNVIDIYGDPIKNAVFALEEDRNGNIWAGYWIDGLVKFTFDENRKLLKTSNFQFSNKDPNSLSNNYIRDILEDSNNNLWVGTVGGLNKVVRDKNGKITFNHYLYNSSDQLSLSNNYVLDIFETKGGEIYVGTFGGGLNKLEFSTQGKITFKHYTTHDGLPSDVIFQIREDRDGNIWMQHIREISRLNPKTGEIIYFDNQDGFTVDEFKDNAMFYTSKGLMLTAGVNGFTYFQPDNLTVNKTKPKLAFEDFRLFQESVKPLEKVRNHLILEKDINETEIIELPYFLNSIEFVFSSLHFSNPEKNQYKYILEGFTEKWQYSKGNERRFASYTNVPPGEYVFKVDGSSSSGVWTNNPKQIVIIINPPWYLTIWALLFFTLLATGIIYLIIRNRSNQIRLQSELELESALHEKSDEINQMKLQFFTNISHELRTPLTLIIGPLQQIMQGNTNPEYLKKLNAIMYKNSVRLLNLINQLLDFRKAESGKIKLAVQEGDLVDFITEISHAFEEIAAEKDIKFLFLSENKFIEAWFDNDKIEKILYNLLSNAFKFTPKGKSIKLTLEKITKEGKLYGMIKVIDYGIGIQKEELESIFERFYQTKKEDNSIHIGSGLGLAYTKHLVEIHKGEINIESELHVGTTCIITIPISKSAYEKESIIESQLSQYDFKFTRKEITGIKENSLIESQLSQVQDHGDETPKILIVEDNTELRNYLSNYFGQSYNVITAPDGVEGFAMAIDKDPNIIISDLMMPKMDGIEMCKKIKTNIQTSHIPVIILTAKSGLENEKEGLETGADEFVLKPFSIEILKLRIENILRTKQQWIQKFQTDTNTKSFSGLSNKLDQRFLKKAIGIIKKNIDNPEFSVEIFASDIAMSRSALFKKLKSITGQSTTEFIRSIRLKKAIKYLNSGKYSITEIIFMVGFSDPKYFRTCFKKQFGKSPSEYIKSMK